MRKLLVLCLLFVAGCTTTPLYQSHDQVSIYLASEPEVKENGYKIKLKFQSPTNDPHLIQWIDLGQWHGVESFRVMPDYKSWTDTHSTEDTLEQHRKITIAPGEVEGVDDTFGGFAMLPSEWPPNFNAIYQKNHAIQGRVVYRLPEHETIYYLSFKDGVLQWWVEGSNEKQEWRADGK
jgi:hypothetical protein